MWDAWAGWPALREILAERPNLASSVFDEAYNGDRGYARRRRRYRPAEAVPPPAPPPNAMDTPSMKPKSYQLPLFWTS